MKKLLYHNQIGINDLISEIKDIDKNLYNDKIMFGVALYKNENTLKPSFITVKFLSKGDSIPTDIEYYYDDFIIIRKGISYDNFIDILNRIRDANEISITPELKFLSKQENWDTSYVFSNQDWGYVEHEYPGMYFQSRFKTEVDGFIPNYTLAGKDYPPYPTGERALQHIFGLKHLWNLERLFVINIPNFSAKINSLNILDKEIHVNTITSSISTDHLRIQYYISGEGFVTTNASTKLKNGIAIIPLKNEPDEILIVLIDKDGNVLDKKHTSLQYVERDPSIRTETSSSSILKMISMGEGKHIEFKSKLGNLYPFVESVVAFANTEGGRILLGVDNNGNRVKGFDDPKIAKETITNWIADYCDPKIDVRFEYSEELEILVIAVPEGKDKPYDLKGKGPFLRVDSTDRIASRSERDSMSKREENRGLSPYGLI